MYEFIINIELSVIYSLECETKEAYAVSFSSVIHMEYDLHRNDGSILYSDTKLRTTNGNDMSIIASDFASIAQFSQINHTHIAAADCVSMCVRLVNREDNSVRTLAGVYRRRGTWDGKPGNLYYPHSIVKDERTPSNILVGEIYALRSIDIGTGTVITVLKGGFVQIRSMTWYWDRLLVCSSTFYALVLCDITQYADNSYIITDYGGRRYVFYI